MTNVFRERLTVRLMPGLKRQVETESHREELSVNQFVVRAIREALYESRHRLEDKKAGTR